MCDAAMRVLVAGIYAGRLEHAAGGGIAALESASARVPGGAATETKQEIKPFDERKTGAPPPATGGGARAPSLDACGPAVWVRTNS